jgi:YVTN family beta-propeller protein
MQNKKIVLTILISLLTLLIYLYSNNEKINSKAYITNQGDNTVSVVDLIKLEVIKTIKVGVAPLGITILNKKNLAFIGNVGTDDIHVIDTNTDEIIRTIKLNTAPLSLTSSPDESLVYVTDWFKNNILTISVDKMKVIDSIEVGKTPSGITFNKKYGYLIITNRDSDAVEIYKENKLIKRLTTGRHPFGVYTKGQYAYTANVYDDSITIINLVDWTTKIIKVGAHPYNVLTHQNLGFVTNTVDDSLSIIDLKIGKEIKQINTGETPENLDIHRKLNLLIVTNWGSDSISVYSLKNLKLIKEIKTGAQSRSFGEFILQ